MTGGILTYMIFVGCAVVALFLVASVWALVNWIIDTIHYRSIHHTIATGGRHRGDGAE